MNKFEKMNKDFEARMAENEIKHKSIIERYKKVEAELYRFTKKTMINMLISASLAIISFFMGDFFRISTFKFIGIFLMTATLFIGVYGIIMIFIDKKIRL